MTDREHRHPDLDRLAEFAARRLGGPEASEVARHAERCVACRLELKRLVRFASIDRDAALEEEAGWRDAEPALERAFREAILPASLPESGPERARGARRLAWPARRAPWARLRSPKVWALPAAAALALAVVLIGIVNREEPGPRARGLGTMRGGVAAGRAIVPLAPIGLLAEPPGRFSWSTEARFDSFALEVLTPELDRVFYRMGIEDTTMAVADTLRALLSSGKTYLWSVQGYRGLTPAETSVHAWFKAPGHPPEG